MIILKDQQIVVTAKLTHRLFLIEFDKSRNSILTMRARGRPTYLEKETIIIQL